MGVSKPVVSLYDAPMWESFKVGRFDLQTCRSCGTVRYPPGPVCHKCLSMDYDWKPVSGRGAIMSWVVFHRKYFDDHPSPYNAVAVQLAEGPIVVSNLRGPEPEGTWIGAEVEFVMAPHGDRIQHHVRLLGAP